MQNFKGIDRQEVLHLLPVFDAYLKEAKTTFLIPARMILYLFIINLLVRYQGSCIQNLKFLVSQEVRHLLQVFDVSLKDAQMVFLIPSRMTLIVLIFFISNHLVGYHGSCIQNHKFLVSQEVIHFLPVFDVSLKEAKTTFQIPARMI